MQTHLQVPRSSKVVTEDNDYVLVTVVMFKRVVDEFKTAARTKGYQVRMTACTQPGILQCEEICHRHAGWVCALQRDCTPCTKHSAVHLCMACLVCHGHIGLMQQAVASGWWSGRLLEDRNSRCSSSSIPGRMDTRAGASSMYASLQATAPAPCSQRRDAADASSACQQQ